MFSIRGPRCQASDESLYMHVLDPLITVIGAAVLLAAVTLVVVGIPFGIWIIDLRS